MMNYYGDYGMMPYGFGAFGFLFMLLWWVLIIIAIVIFVRWAVRQGHGWRHEDKHPVEILKERYARGEITKAEYEEMKREIEK